MKFMSNEALYWVLLLFIFFVLTMVAGLLLMRKTNSLKTSFFCFPGVEFCAVRSGSLLVGGHRRSALQQAVPHSFYGIAFFNNLLLTMFAVLSIQKKKNPR